MYIRYTQTRLCVWASIFFVECVCMSFHVGEWVSDSNDAANSLHSSLSRLNAEPRAHRLAVAGSGLRFFFIIYIFIFLLFF